MALPEPRGSSTTRSPCAHPYWIERRPEVRISTHSWAAARALGLGKDVTIGLMAKRLEEEVCGQVYVTCCSSKLPTAEGVPGHQVVTMMRSVNVSQTLSADSSLFPTEIVYKEATRGPNNMDFPSLRLTWLLPLLNTQLVNNKGCY